MRRPYNTYPRRFRLFCLGLLVLACQISLVPGIITLGHTASRQRRDLMGGSQSLRPDVDGPETGGLLRPSSLEQSRAPSRDHSLTSTVADFSLRQENQFGFVELRAIDNPTDPIHAGGTTRSSTLASCRFVYPPIAPSQMDCYTKLEAGDSFNDPTSVGTSPRYLDSQHTWQSRWQHR